MVLINNFKIEGVYMRGIVLEKGEKYYTYIKKYFYAINNKQKDYNWLISDMNCYPQSKKYDELFSKEYCWISGKNLTEIIDNEDFLWIWGVFSGFHQNISKEEVLEYELPFADGYKGFWNNPISIQHPLADIELVCWDGNFFLLISKDDYIIEEFQKHFPLSEDLKIYNERE